MARSALWYFFGGVLAFLIGCELLLHVLPVSTAMQTGYHIDPLINTALPNHVFRTATGWDLRNAQTVRTNNFGFVAALDFSRDEHAVALIGDSFVEASMLPAEQRPGWQLQAALAPSRPVYAMGAPGTALLDYAERIRFAYQTLGVRDFVLLMERFDVRQSFCGSGNVAGPCLRPDTLAAATELQAPPGRAKRILRHSALVQYLHSQLGLDPARLWQQVLAQARPATAEPKGKPPAAAPAPTQPLAHELARLAVVTETFFQRIRPYRDGRLVIVLDSDRAAIERGSSTADAARDHFMALAKAEGALLIDTEPLYREHAARSELKLQVGPYDGHLNPLGVGIAMTAAARALR